MNVPLDIKNGKSFMTDFKSGKEGIGVRDKSNSLVLSDRKC